ncbi:MAG: DUF4232 domain-containing protein [Actinomycetota bacterium]|nr:DUF4232 domain-containing protein [Actinomycetota bacterium]
MHGSLTSGGGAAGSTYRNIVLTNIGSHACTSGGFGGVSYVDSPQGQPIGAPAQRRGGHSMHLLVLRPGERIVAQLQETNSANYDPGTCRSARATGLRVFPPNQKASLFLRHGATACRNPKVKLLSIQPFHFAP